MKHFHEKVNFQKNLKLEVSHKTLINVIFATGDGYTKPGDLCSAQTTFKPPCEISTVSKTAAHKAL